MAEQDQFGPPGNLSSERGGGYVDDVKMALSKFYDNYMSRSLTDKEKQEVDRISKMFNVSRVNEDLVRHYVVGQRYRGLAAPVGTFAAFLGELVDASYGTKKGKGAFSPDDVFGTLYGSYGFTPEQVNKVGGFKHTESWQDMVENKSKHQGFWGKNFSKMQEIAKNQFNTSPTILGIDVSPYMDPQKNRVSFYMDDINPTPNITENMMDLNFSTKGMLGAKSADPRGGGT
tara:strand:+ start:3438 stop:4127 length:690 start_codon:yes stop_codon:yes gene_type:complete